VFLGIGEAGYYAGMIYYLSFWYKRHEIAFRVRHVPLSCTWNGVINLELSLVMNGPLAGAISGLLAFGLVRAHTSVLAGWQFLFLVRSPQPHSLSSTLTLPMQVEAIPSIILAFAVLFYLPSFPFAATFLSPRERAIAQARLNRDHRPRSHGGMAGWQAFKAIITDLNAWLFTVAYCGFAMATTSISYFVPTVSLSPSTLTISLYTITMSWAASTFSPTSKRGIGTAFIVSISNCLAIVILKVFSALSAAPQIYFDPEDKFRKGHAITAGCVFVSFIGAVALRARLISRNQEKAKMLARMTSEEKVVPEMEELWDSDPRYFFII
ncbi:hypothetical protein H0H93_011653, partial [Arthromyces matolae]